MCRADQFVSMTLKTARACARELGVEVYISSKSDLIFRFRDGFQRVGIGCDRVHPSLSSRLRKLWKQKQGAEART